MILVLSKEPVLRYRGLKRRLELRSLFTIIIIIINILFSNSFCCGIEIGTENCDIELLTTEILV